MDINLNYTVCGEGLPLILLHGNGEDGTYFKNQIEYFAKFYKVIAIDTRGHGLSPKGIKPFTLMQFADDLYDFMVEHEIAKANILGFSDGGNIALIFALRHPDMIEKLVLNGANLNPRGVRAIYQMPITIGYMAASLFKGGKNNADMLRLMVKEPNISVQQLSDLNVETLVIAGTKDMIKRSHTKLIGSSIPNAKTVFLEGDHFIASKNPDKFNEAVHSFLK